MAVDVDDQTDPRRDLAFESEVPAVETAGIAARNGGVIVGITEKHIAFGRNLGR
jgi:hypothetical protein